MSEPPSVRAGRTPGSDAPDAAPHHHFLVQAPVPAVDADGLGVVSVGTVLFGIASVVLFLLRPRLLAAGHAWWLPVCVTGFVLGLLGLLYCWNRVRRRPGPPPS